MANYFGDNEENLVKKYIATRNSKLYEDHVHSLLKKIAYGVRRKYHFQPKVYFESASVISDCVSLMWEKLVTTYNPSSESKAYSYLTRIAHNYFCGVYREWHKADRTRRYTARAVASIWNNMHHYGKSREELLIEGENTTVRKRLINRFLSEHLYATSIQKSEILDGIEKLPSTSKKAANKIIIETLDLKGSKKLYRRKERFRENVISIHKKTGSL